ncbi:hypothetical protein [Methanoculleus sp.]|uniref:hypothetical protein n=1 Tax=Methanoculleus sp. TaxID=90427 RepID=UPI00272ECA0B|nr:hypothetical protein [Methanoculleus sp.]
MAVHPLERTIRTEDLGAAETAFSGSTAYRIEMEYLTMRVRRAYLSGEKEGAPLSTCNPSVGLIRCSPYSSWRTCLAERMSGVSRVTKLSARFRIAVVSNIAS